MISEDRKKHIWGVADAMKNFAMEKNLSDEEVEDYYMLGLLHDIGYEFAEPESYQAHNVIGGGVLKRLGYKHWQEVYYHGVVEPSYKSELLDVLNCIDMHVDSVGKYVSFEERLQELSTRYNIPIDKLDSKPMIDWLISRGFN